MGRERITCVCNGRTESGKQATHTKMVGGKQAWHPIVIAFYQISCVTRCKCGAEYGVDRPHNAKVVSVQERKKYQPWKHTETHLVRSQTNQALKQCVYVYVLMYVCVSVSL